MRHDLLSDVLSAIQNGDRVGKRETTTAASGLVKAVLQLLQRQGFIGNFELIDDGRGGKFRIGLLGRVNRCGAVRPRFSAGKDEWEEWERRFLPAAGFGALIVSTSGGVMTHEEAKRQGLGGKLLGFVY